MVVAIKAFILSLMFIVVIALILVLAGAGIMALIDAIPSIVESSTVFVDSLLGFRPEWDEGLHGWIEIVSALSVLAWFFILPLIYSILNDEEKVKKNERKLFEQFKKEKGI